MVLPYPHPQSSITAAAAKNNKYSTIIIVRKIIIINVSNYNLYTGSCSVNLIKSQQLLTDYTHKDNLLRIQQAAYYILACSVR